MQENFCFAAEGYAPSVKPRFLFHYSPWSNRESIMEEGLLPQKDGKRLWDFSPPGVYMFSSPLRAWDWQNLVCHKLRTLPSTSEDDGLEGDVWMVDSQGLDLHTDPTMGEAVYCQEDIPAHRLTRIPRSLCREFKQRGFRDMRNFREEISHHYTPEDIEHIVQAQEYLTEQLESLLCVA